ncbi:glycosyltransferase family 9 protein [Saccharomonospora xinjiangensis]|uniref:ADP-heptose:LPS heptosyltransferase n=1 Tax=Saccharomonospora xinjiangensis XJ-54 TaxID=882086 RepID=I0UYZ5_9PSEU|nr:glycosyltransferase family 9 protein [Saccharomonospora xinjiangensis]EID53098.1 ADP-heptose:LPS heptosyltransferase [Saccharomonospora xinjiangensis XJ-54]
MKGRILVARLDNIGDVLLAGPAVRAVAARADHVVLLAGPRGRAGAELLPGVDEIVEWCAPWIDPEPPALTGDSVNALVKQVRDLRLDGAFILTSFHQSPLPLALVLRLAGVPWIGAISDDYPGSLLDLRHRVEEDLPEAERALSLVTAAGLRLPDGDDGALAVRHPLPDTGALTGEAPFVVVHPAASVPARQPSWQRSADAVSALAEAGHRVVVTGGVAERDLVTRIVGAARADADGAGEIVDLGGATTLPQLASVMAAADVVVAPNTGPAHLAAAVGTPVVSLFAPVVPSARWAPYGVPRVVLGDQNAPCRNTRARHCPVPGHPCLAIDAADIVEAVETVKAGNTVNTGNTVGTLGSTAGGDRGTAIRAGTKPTGGVT